VTFLFTGIEARPVVGKADPETMRSELAAHDGVLRTMIDAHGRWLFK
jgi:hypothetical protein